MLSGEYRKFYERLAQKISPERMYHDPLHTLTFGTDASFYRMIPRLVVKASDEEEVSFLLQEAERRKYRSHSCAVPFIGRSYDSYADSR